MTAYDSTEALPDDEPASADETREGRMKKSLVTIASRRRTPRAGAVVYRCETCGKRAPSKQRRLWPFGFNIQALDNWRVSPASTMTVNSKGIAHFLGLCPKHADA